MILLNFAHPLTESQLARVAELVGRPVERVVAVPARFDHAASFADQVKGLIAATGLTPDEWQTLPLLVNLPSLAPIAAVLLAELHGRTGYFPAVLRLRPIHGVTPPHFEVG